MRLTHRQRRLRDAVIVIVLFYAAMTAAFLTLLVFHWEIPRPERQFEVQLPHETIDGKDLYALASQGSADSQAGEGGDPSAVTGNPGDSSDQLIVPVIIDARGENRRAEEERDEDAITIDLDWEIAPLGDAGS